jgi:hypothetical protein
MSMSTWTSTTKGRPSSHVREVDVHVDDWTMAGCSRSVVAFGVGGGTDGPPATTVDPGELAGVGELAQPEVDPGAAHPSGRLELANGPAGRAGRPQGVDQDGKGAIAIPHGIRAVPGRRWDGPGHAGLAGPGRPSLAGCGRRRPGQGCGNDSLIRRIRGDAFKLVGRPTTSSWAGDGDLGCPLGTGLDHTMWHASGRRRGRTELGPYLRGRHRPAGLPQPVTRRRVRSQLPLAQVCSATGMRARRAVWRGRRPGRPGCRPRCRQRT